MTARRHTASPGGVVRWGWVSAIALGTLLGLVAAGWLGETGAAVRESTHKIWSSP